MAYSESRLTPLRPRAHEGNATRTQASRYAFVGGFDGTSNVLAVRASV